MNASCLLGNIQRFVRDERGATAIEYALIATGIAVAIVASVSSLGTTVQATYQRVQDAFAN